MLAGKRMWVGAAVLMLGACASAGGDVVTSRPGTPGDTISIAAGPCFGVCPSYSVTVTPDGSGLLEPRKNTAVPGLTRFTVTPAQYRRLRAALAPFRPATGTAKRIGGKEHCTRFATDMPTYKIAWDQAGASRTQLDFQSGCQDARYARLRAALVATPRTLDIAPMLKARP